MKSYYALLFICFFSCIQSKKTTTTNASTNKIQLNHNLPKEFRVVKIDSVNNVYLIYARKGDYLYKILSAKDSCEQCNNIRVNAQYGFILHSLFPKQQLIKYDLSPTGYPRVDGILFNGTGIILEKDSINDLFIADNMKGLCAKLQ